MTNFLHLIIIIIFVPTYLFSETLTIYATQSAQYSANDCCTLNILTNQNSNSLHSQDCQDMGAYYGCGMSKQVPFWIFDLSILDSSVDIQSIQFKGNLPTESWSDVYLSISTTVGQISTTIASDLWNGGDWDSGNGQYSSINWPMGDFSQNLPLEIISQGVLSGQLNILTYTSNPWTIFSIVNSGDNAPRLVIDYENISEQVDYQTQIQTIFNNNCTSCHINGGAYYGGLDLSSYDSLMAGSNNGPVVVSGDHANSLLWQKVNSGEMPPQNNANFTNDEISLIAQWIDEGALLITTYEGPVWHVSTNGSDSTGDGSEANPFATIQAGIDAASDGDTVLVAAGTYVENIIINNNISLLGQNPEMTIIDGNASGFVVTSLINENFLMKNFTVLNGIGGIQLGPDNGNYIIENTLIVDNNETYAISCYSDTLILKNVTITNNPNPWGSVIVFDGGHLYITNCNIFNEIVGMETYITLGLVWNDDATAMVEYSNILGGVGSMYASGGSSYNWGEGNIDADPLFCYPNTGDYTLSENSPCVGSGENGANMGAFDIGCAPIYFGDLVINEIMKNPSAVSDNDGEWFELYNNSEEPADISDWIIKDNGDDSLQIASNTTLISPHGYFVLGTNDDTTANGDIIVDYVYDRENFNLGNSNDEIILLSSFGDEIDRVQYDNGTNFPDPNGLSMELIYHNLDNNDGANWVESTNMLPSGDYGTPGQGNSTLLPVLATDIDTDCHGGVNNGWMDLGIIEINDTSECMLIVSNAGYGDLILSNIHIGEINDNPNTAFSVTIDSLEPELPAEASLVIPPEGSDSIIVHFAPEEAGFYSGNLSFDTNDENSPTHNEAAHGTGLSPVSEIHVQTDFDSDTLYFYDAQIGDDSFFESIYIFNLGNTPLEIDDIIATEPFHVGIITDGSLEPVETLEVPVQFYPDSAGDYSGTVTIYSNDSDEEEVVIHLYGNTETLSIDEIPIPDKFTLHQNHPNPFNPVTTLRYDLPEDANVNITIYDMMGRVVKTMVNSQQNAGFKSIHWNATNDKGSPVSAGLYLYTIQAGEFRQTKKMVLLK